MAIKNYKILGPPVSFISRPCFCCINVSYDGSYNIIHSFVCIFSRFIGFEKDIDTHAATHYELQIKDSLPKIRAHFSYHMISCLQEKNKSNHFNMIYFLLSLIWFFCQTVKSRPRIDVWKKIKSVTVENKSFSNDLIQFFSVDQKSCSRKTGPGIQIIKNVRFLYIFSCRPAIMW